MVQAKTERAIAVWVDFQFSGSQGVAALSGSGVNAVVLSGTTYTLSFKDAWPQVRNLSAQMLWNSSYFGTTSGTMDLVFNGSQLNQLRTMYTGSSVQPSSSGNPQTIDFVVQQGTNGLLVTPAYFSGTNRCFIQAVFANQDYLLG